MSQRVCSLRLNEADRLPEAPPGLFMTMLTISFVPAKSFATPFLVLLAAFALALTLAAPSLAQSAPDASNAAAGVWSRSIGDQHAKLLRSSDVAVQVVAMQNIIVLTAQRPGEFDLRPVVPALLGIYENDANNRQLRIMAVATLRAVGDEYGMEQLYQLSSREHRASMVYQVAQNAVKHYYSQEAMEREEARSAYFLSKGDLENAEKHALRAAVHRSRLG